jgi:lipid-binding SYLF domain-containing protein
MNSSYGQPFRLLWSVVAILFALTSGSAFAGSADIDREADVALAKLYAGTPVAKKLAGEAVAVLVFPSVIKGGLMIGGQYGKGVLRKDGKSVGYYRSDALSYGLQAGAQSFGYALFFMTPETLAYLDKSEGWELGVGPSIVVMDEGMAKSMTTTTAKEGIYAFIFGQKGLMAGIGLQGSKITRIDPDK